MLQPGSQIGRYEIQRRLGRGGMGTVYVAHDPVLGRMVAIKVFATDLDLPDAAQRFAREARAAAALNHPNIVTIHDYGDVSSQPFIVMEYVQGETLAEIIRGKSPVPLSDKLRWMEELCAGADYAHRNGVLHRDIKPTNLMCNRSSQLKILDFGIARMMGTLSPKATALVGTPGYMAPEQILGETLDHRADLFSIGVVVYELLAYTEAFPGETLPTITHRILTWEPVSLAQLVPDLHPELAAIVDRCLRKNPAERFDDAESLRVAFSRIRRQIENDPSWNAAAPTVIVDRPGPGISKRGTGSEKRPVPDAIGVAQLTPPPDPHRIDREVLARRRTEQIAGCLARSRELLEAGNAPAALDACIQALTLEENHRDALELEQTINAVLAAQRAEALRAEAAGEMVRQSLTSAQGLLQQARELDPDNPDLKKLERELRLARARQTEERQRAEAVAAALVRAEQALTDGETEAALASARYALGLDADSVRAREIEAIALRRLDEDSTSETRIRLGDLGLDPSAPTMHLDLPPTVLSHRSAQRVSDASAADASPTIIAPAGRKAGPAPADPQRTPPPTMKVALPPAAAPPAAAPVARTPDAPAPTAKAPAPSAPGTAKMKAVQPRPAKPKTDPLAGLKASFARSTTAARAGWQARPKQQRTMMLGGAAAALVLIAIVVVVLTRPPSLPPTGIVALDAVPWATITRIEAEDGTAQPLPAEPSTPLELSLSAGTYRVTMVGPPPGSEMRVVTVQVQADGTAAPAAERFQIMTADEYFEQYLASPTPGIDAAAPATAPADAAAPAAGSPAGGPTGAAPQGAPQ